MNSQNRKEQISSGQLSGQSCSPAVRSVLHIQRPQLIRITPHSYVSPSVAYARVTSCLRDVREGYVLSPWCTPGLRPASRGVLQRYILSPWCTPGSSPISVVYPSVTSRLRGVLQGCVLSPWCTPGLRPVSVVLSSVTSCLRGVLQGCALSPWCTPGLCPVSVVYSRVTFCLLWCTPGLHSASRSVLQGSTTGTHQRTVSPRPSPYTQSGVGVCM